jgi:uncharacterized repeat protein (TIGR02543 family)
MRKLSKIFSILLLAICGFFIASTIDLKAAPTVVSLTYPGTTSTMTGENQAALLGLDDTLFSVKGIQKAASQNVYIAASQLRLYYGAGENGNLLEIAVVVGHKIINIEYTMTSTKYAPTVEIIVDGGAPVTHSDYGTSIEISEISANSITIQNVHSTNEQLRLSNIKITYIVEAGAIERIEGAQIRTEGTQGLRFSAKVNDAASVQEKGFYLLKGVATLLDLEEAIAEADPITGAMSFNGKSVFKVVVSGMTPENEFSVVLTGIPEKGYMDDITVIAYATLTNSEDLYVLPVTRSIGRVAILMEQAGDPLPQGVQNVLTSLGNFKRARYVGDNYEVTKGLKDATNNYIEDLSPYELYAPEVTEITLPTPAAREGYTFGGWYNNSSHGGDPITTVATSSITGTHMYYGKWTLNTYTVTFNANGGGPTPDQQTINHGETATEPAAPTKPGEYFGGWLLDGSEFNFSTPITGNITLYAKWNTTPLLYSYDFTDGGDNDNSAYSGINLITKVSYASDNPGGTTGTTSWTANRANLKLTTETRLGEDEEVLANIYTNFTYTETLTKVEVLGAYKFGIQSAVTGIYLQISTDGVNWTTIATAEGVTGTAATIVFDGLSIVAGNHIRIAVQITGAPSKNSGLAFNGIKVYGTSN